jgi:hypothetical protein
VFGKSSFCIKQIYENVIKKKFRFHFFSLILYFYHFFSSKNILKEKFLYEFAKEREIKFTNMENVAIRKYE